MFQVPVEAFVAPDIFPEGLFKDKVQNLQRIHLLYKQGGIFRFSWWSYNILGKEENIWGKMLTNILVSIILIKYIILK